MREFAARRFGPTRRARIGVTQPSQRRFVHYFAQTIGRHLNVCCTVSGKNIERGRGGRGRERERKNEKGTTNGCVVDRGTQSFFNTFFPSSLS